jgi:hypothetical protein
LTRSLFFHLLPFFDEIAKGEQFFLVISISFLSLQSERARGPAITKERSGQAILGNGLAQT